MNVVLLEPEIAPNTGNIARLCAATGSDLHLIEPLGFRLDDRELKRAGMDYWRQVTWKSWPNWSVFVSQLPEQARWWWIESGGSRQYSDVSYAENDYLVFGRESAGLPRLLLDSKPEAWLSIPMRNSEARSLNLSNCVAIVLYEALRQLGRGSPTG